MTTTQAARGAALFSEDGRYRYRLDRAGLGGGYPLRPVNMILLNPSTADAERDDPTIRRCMGFARSWGYDRLIITNLFAYRATNPSWLRRSEAPVGELVPPPFAHDRAVPVDRRGAPPYVCERNDLEIMRAAREAELVVVAWGAYAAASVRAPHVAAMLVEAGIEPMAFGVTNEGHPRHPLYLRRETALRRWPVGGAS